MTDRHSSPRPACPQRRRITLAGCGVLALRVVPDAFAHQAAPAPISGFELPKPIALKPFRLTDQHGRLFDRVRLERRWTLLLFGFTRCPDVCPTTLAQIAQVRRFVAAQPDDAPTEGVFITIDPKRDTREQLARYVAQFDATGIGVTGSPSEIDALAKQFRIRYVRSGGQAEGYLFDHTASVSLIGPDARLYAIFTLPLRPEKVAADLGRMHANYLKASCTTNSSDALRSCKRGA